jgi:tRNA (cmo5U34)-methyltransferase
MGVASHLGIQLREYDARIRTFIPDYEAILDAAAAALAASHGQARRVVDLGTGTGALAARVLRVLSSARVTGIDADEAMLGLARRRLGSRLTATTGDFLDVPLPRADAITASFALHHIRTPRPKRQFYSRCYAALTRGGVLVNADCMLASNARLQARDRAAWHGHLARHYGRTRASAFLRAWADEDVYFRLDDELRWLRACGFTVDVPWRQGSFAVVVATKS